MVEYFRPHNPGGPGFDQLDCHDKPFGPTLYGPAGGDVIDVEQSGGVCRTDVSFMQGEHRPLRNDEHATQFREPGDHIERETIGSPAAGNGDSRPIDERHDRDGCAPRDGSGNPLSFDACGFCQCGSNAGRTVSIRAG